MPDPIENYLSDTIKLLIEDAKDANDKVQQLRTSGPSPDLDFESGRSFGLFQAVSLLHSQIQSFNLDPTRVGFPAGFDPENGLVK